MTLKLTLNALRKGGKAKVGKAKTTKKVSKHNAKAAKHRVEKLSADITDVDEIHQLLGEALRQKEPPRLTALNIKELKEDYEKDVATKEKNKAAAKDLEDQLELITKMGF